MLVAAAARARPATWRQVAFGVYDDPTASTLDAEVLSGFLLGVISAGIGMWALPRGRRCAPDPRAPTREAVHVELAVKALEQEEVRVRRAVAEGLHGTLARSC